VSTRPSFATNDLVLFVQISDYLLGRNGNKPKTSKTVDTFVIGVENSLEELGLTRSMKIVGVKNEEL